MNPKQLLSCHYGIHTDRIQKVPGGTTEYTYAVEDRFFFKAYDKALEMTAPVVEWLPRQLEALTLLKEAEGLKGHLCYPIPTNNGALYAENEQMACALFNLIPGKTIGWENPFTAEEAEGLAELLTALHAIPTEPFERLCPRETFTLAFAEQFTVFLEIETEQLPPQFAALAVEYRMRILERMRETIRLGAQLQTEDLPFVLCHTDAHGGNLMKNDAGWLWLIDWENLMLAPKEADLFGYCEDAYFDSFTRRAKMAVDSRALTYYTKRRDLEDLWGFFYSACYETDDPEKLETIFGHIARIAAHLCG